MIITRIPFRLPLAGGGTDLPSFCSKHGAFLVTASINKYMYVSINEPQTSDKIKIYYAFTERVSSVSEIKHNIIRESLKYHNIDHPIEIGSMADIDAGTGMGSSSAFTVGLLSGLNALRNRHLSPAELAEEACSIEIEKVGKPIGKQDQYAVALGGINRLIIDTSGKVTVTRIDLDPETIRQLENRLLIFYTGITRSADEILSEENKKIEASADHMEFIKTLAYDIEESLLSGDIDSFGKCLHSHWSAKRSISKSMTSGVIDNYFRGAMNNGAIGGKIMGAGGGGFMLLCCEDGKRSVLKEAMLRRGLKYMDWRFEFDGCKLLTNI
jgi:D-glycero-alpha-D-manno-heptose-7-phosphate kinase